MRMTDLEGFLAGFLWGDVRIDLHPLDTPISQQAEAPQRPPTSRLDALKVQQTASLSTGKRDPFPLAHTMAHGVEDSRFVCSREYRDEGVERHGAVVEDWPAIECDE